MSITKKDQAVNGWVNFLTRHKRIRYTILVAYDQIQSGRLTFEEAKKAFIESTGLDSSITGAISFYGRHTDSSCPTADQLLQMVDNLQTDRAKK